MSCVTFNIVTVKKLVFYWMTICYLCRYCGWNASLSVLVDRPITITAQIYKRKKHSFCAQTSHFVFNLEGCLAKLSVFVKLSKYAKCVRKSQIKQFPNMRHFNHGKTISCNWWILNDLVCVWTSNYPLEPLIRVMYMKLSTCISVVFLFEAITGNWPL